MKSLLPSFTPLSRSLRLWLIACLMGVVPAISAVAQTISGTVIGADDQKPLPGVSILVKGTNTGTTTNANGTYSLNVSNASTATLTFSFIGYETQVVAIGNQTTINVSLSAGTSTLGEVVVTALGIQREKKALGYATQEIQGNALTIARETNVTNQLAGKIAGVTVVGSPSGIGGSARVTIRGERSVDLNKNQPLYVIDGVPVSNGFTGGSGRNNTEVDFGNGASFINPDDIESMNVLKGAAASALYGARAANGVIVIKTKSGRGSKGIGVEINTNQTFETPLVLPKYQNVYGQGNANGGDFAFVNGAGGGLTDGTDEAWGPAFSLNKNYPQYNSPRTLNGQPIDYRGGDLNAPAGSVITATPWVPETDNLKKFLQTGNTHTTNVAVTGNNESGNFRLAHTYVNQTGIVPNTDLKRYTTSFSGGYHFTPKFSANSFVSYIKGNSGNRPSISYGTESIMYLFNCWLPPSVALDPMKDYWMRGQEGIRQFSWNYNYHDNPYLTVYENTNGQLYDRLIGNVSLKYDLTPWLSVQGRTAIDYTNEKREYRRAFSTQRFPFGQYRESRIVTEERNTDFLFTANKEVNQNWTVSGTLGGNQLQQKSDFLENNAGQLNIPGIYNLTNSRIPLQTSQAITTKRVNSLYGSAQVGFRNYLFLELTARNDWSSALTLPVYARALGVQDNSYFYPSAALSAVLSDMFVLPQQISFLKARVNYASVGNDTDPFTFTQSYNPSDPFGSSQVYGETDRLANFSLKPEISNSFEGGVELKLFKRRVGLDFSYYLTNTRNQILNIPLSITSGYNSRAINAGLIRNQGVEVALNLVPVEKANSLRWALDLNFSANRSKVIELSDNIQNFVMASRGVSIEARVGERMGDMYGIAFARVQNTDPTKPYYDASGRYVGQMVFANGRPVPTTERVKLGNYNPDFLLGINNSVSYKNVRLSFLFDIREGGKLYSETQTVGREGGIIIETLEGRANGYDLSLPGNGVIGQGVTVTSNADGSSTFAPNDVKLNSRQWHTAWTGGRNIAEGVMFDASFVKLREVQLGFSIPDRIWGKVPLRGVTLSLVGRNLAVWSKVPHVDPETMSYSGGTALPGIEYMAIPTTRSFGFNLGLKL
ncbi:SusC/RagA family TonB-linked outer membrane protein [Spirosoma terrae]|uniref:SusC/RagA family TonB-linked outer membrane protein n=1 Tax=Spirosoma terrae TaxID=1968276 RepID=A0A6L9LG02_9BACT|nr:SusC/RagA family TonB-linked outer membrane protein [Spirosoma terrae]NDU95589.1 SusC/RagA family TonB-linked outer membrane protein [Spirosoma terrae]